MLTAQTWGVAALVFRLTALGSALLWVFAYAPLVLQINGIHQASVETGSPYQNVLRGFRTAIAWMVLLLGLAVVSILVSLVAESRAGWGAANYDVIVVASTLATTIAAPAPLYTIINSFFTLEVATSDHDNN